MSELRSADVDQKGLLRVLGENLYSTPEVAVRELVQNAHDSLTRRRLEGGDFEARVDVIADPGAGTLTIRDTGAGLTRDEIHAYLATIGAGYTRLLRGETGDEALIGAFGLGFLSAYVVSTQVVVTTTSHREPGQTLIFRSADGLRYTIDEAPSPSEVGTEVRLTVAAEHRQLCDPVEVRRLLDRYARLLPFPIFAPDRINGEPVPWRQPADEVHPARVQQRLLDVARQFDPWFEPLCAFPIVATPELDVRGVLWVQGGGTWATSDNRRVALYVRGMFVSDEVRAVLPEWAGFVGGVIECDALVPTASREDVQRDRIFGLLQQALAEQLIAGLCQVVQDRPEAWRRMLIRHADALRGAALADDRLFRALGDDVPVPTSDGDLRLPEAAAQGPLYVAVGDDSGYELVLHRALGRPVIEGVRFGALALAERWAELHGRPVVILGTEAGNRELFPPVTVEPEAQAAFERWFGDEDRGVVATRFAPPTVPLLLVPDRDVLLKRRIEDDESDRRITAGVLSLARSFTDALEEGPAARMFVNLDAPVIGRLLAADPQRAAAGAAVIRAFAEAAGQRAGALGREGAVRDLGDVLASLADAVLALVGEPG